MDDENKKEGVPAQSGESAGDLSKEGVDILSSAREENEFEAPQEKPPLDEGDVNTIDIAKGAEKPEAGPKTRENAPSDIPASLPKEYPRASSPQAPQAPAPQPAPMPKAPMPPVPPRPMQAPVESKPSLADAIKAEMGEISASGAAPHNDPSIKPLRTYKSDVEEAIQGQRISSIQMVVAETKRKQEHESVAAVQTSNKGKSAAIIFLSLVLIVAGGGAAYLAVKSKQGGEPVAPPLEKLSSLIPSDAQTELPLSSSSEPVADAAKAIGRTEGIISTYAYIYPTVATETGRRLATAQEFFTKAATAMPDKIIRSLKDEMMIGAYLGGTKSPFIVLRTALFANTFSGMLEWEPFMERDLRPLVSLAHNGPRALAEGFADIVIENKDVRTLRTEEGIDVLLYAFLDEERLVIAFERETLEKVIRELTTSRVTR